MMKKKKEVNIASAGPSKELYLALKLLLTYSISGPKKYKLDAIKLKFSNKN